MKKNFILGFFALGAMLLGACTTDDTADIKKKPVLSGEMRTVTITTDMTRTALNDHVLSWAEGDTFGIFAIDSDGSGLSHFESPKYEEGKSTYEITVPEETAALYCYYPYDRTNDEDDFETLYINMETFTADGTFKPDYFPMYAKADLSDDGATELTFKPLTALLEFNIYDTKGDGSDLLYSLTFQLPDEAKEGCAGMLIVDLSGDDVSVSGAGTGYITASIEGDVEIGNTKENGAKAYIVVAKRKYEDFYIGIDTKNHPYSWKTSSNGYTFDYASLDLTNTLGGRTINIDLSKAPVAPMIDLDTFKKAAATGPWTALATVYKKEHCAKFVIGAMPTKNSTNSEGDEMNDGYDEEKFIEAAKSSLTAYASQFGMQTYMVYEDEQADVDQLHLAFNAYTDDEPLGLRMKSGVEYTVAVYAVPTDEDVEPQVYTTTFTAPSFSSTNNAAPTISGTASSTKFEGTIEASGALYLFYNVEPVTDDGKNLPTTAENVNAAFANGEGNFVTYNGKIELDEAFRGTISEIAVWAVAIAGNGEISQLAIQRYSKSEVTFSGDAKITAFTEEHLWQTNDDDASPLYELEAKFTLSDAVDKVAIYALPKKATTNSDSPVTITLEGLKSALISEMNSRNGMNFTKAQAEKGVRIPISSTDDGTDSQTGARINVRPDKEYYMFAVAMDASGNYGPIENLAKIGNLDMNSDNFLSTGYTITKDYEKEVKEEEAHYWKQNLKGKYTDWLKFDNLKITEQYAISVYFTADLEWEATADGIDDVAYIYLTKLNASKNTKDLIADQLHTNFDVYNKYTPDTPENVNGTMIWKAYTSVKTVKKYEIDDSLYTDDSNSAVYVMILADKEGYLTMKTAAYLTYDGSNLTPHYIDLTDVDVSSF